MAVKPIARSGILVPFAYSVYVCRLRLPFTCAVNRRNENLRKEFVIKTMFVGED